MRLRAIVLILRKDGLFHLDEAIIHSNFDGWKGFSKLKVEAAYPRAGYGVALVLKPSPVDRDFGVPTLFITEKLFWDIYEAFRVSDQLTYKLLGRGFKSIRTPDEIFME